MRKIRDLFAADRRETLKISGTAEKKEKKMRNLKIVNSVKI